MINKKNLIDFLRKTIENIKIERSFLIFFADFQCWRTKLKYPKLVNIEPILIYYVLDFALKIGAYMESIFHKISKIKRALPSNVYKMFS
jgi:hypothetical protein